MTSLGKIGGSKALAALTTLVNDHAIDTELRENAITALGAIDESASIEVPLDLDLQHLKTNERLALATALGESQSLYRPAAIHKLSKRLTELFSDPSFEVRGASLAGVY